MYVFIYSLFLLNREGGLEARTSSQDNDLD